VKHLAGFLSSESLDGLKSKSGKIDACFLDEQFSACMFQYHDKLKSEAGSRLLRIWLAGLFSPLVGVPFFCTIPLETEP